MNKNKHVVVDLDDVIGDMSLIVEGTLAKRFGYRKCRTTWDTYLIEDLFPITQKDFLQCIIDEQVYERMEPVVGSIQALHKMNAHGYNVHIITARGAHPKAYDITKQWLFEHGAYWDTLSLIEFGKKKSSLFKDVLDDGVFEFFIDDHLSNIEDAIDSNLVKKPIIIEQAWNKNNTTLNHKACRFDSLISFVESEIFEKSVAL